MKTLAYTTFVLAIAGSLSASGSGAAPVPEIDGGTVATGIALASGAMLVLRGRTKK